MRDQLTWNQLEDLKFASSKMTGARRRAFQADIALKYCDGNPNLTEIIFGWGRGLRGNGCCWRMCYKYFNLDLNMIALNYIK